MSEPPAQLRFLLVDDHALVRRGVRELLLEHFPGASFGDANSGTEALNLMATPWDVVVLDISMPAGGGIEAIKPMLQAQPKLKVVVLSTHPENQYAIRVLRAGGAAYLSKDVMPEELITAIRKTLAGGRYVSPTLAEHLATQVLDQDKVVLHERLSDRELQVLRMLAEGKGVKEIGDSLGLSDKTVSTYRGRLLQKMKMRTNSELTRYALKVGLID